MEYMPTTYRPVTAYTATRPILVNGIDINTGLYHVLNYQPVGAQYPYIYVPIAEFSRVGAQVVWDEANQIITVTTDYFDQIRRQRDLTEENISLRNQLGGMIIGQIPAGTANPMQRFYAAMPSIAQPPREYRPVTAYTATRPVFVNGSDINTGSVLH